MIDLVQSLTSHNIDYPRLIVDQFDIDSNNKVIE